MSEGLADAWLEAWAREADALGLEPSPEYWKRGSSWILERVTSGEKPPSGD